MYSLDYSQIVRERFERPPNAGRLFGSVVTGKAGDPSHGTRVEFDFRLYGLLELVFVLSRPTYSLLRRIQNSGSALVL